MLASLCCSCSCPCCKPSPDENREKVKPHGVSTQNNGLHPPTGTFTNHEEIPKYGYVKQENYKRLSNEKQRQHGFVKQENSNGGLSDKRPDSPVKIDSSTQACHQSLEEEEQHGFVKQENSNGDLRDKRMDPPAKTDGRPQAGLRNERHNTYQQPRTNSKAEAYYPPKDKGDGRHREITPDPQKISDSNPEGSQQLLNEQQEVDFKKEKHKKQSQAKRTPNTAEKTGQMSGKETQNGVDRTEPEGINKVDQHTEYRTSPKIAQGGFAQAPEEDKTMKSMSNKLRNKVDQQETGLNSSRTGMSSIEKGQLGKGVKQEGIRDDKTGKGIEDITKKPPKGTQKKDDKNKDHKNRGINLDPTTINFR